MNKIVLVLPVKLVSEANNTDHWTKKAKRKKVLKWHFLSHFAKIDTQITLPCKIKLIRIAPRALDKDDNLPMAFKALKDFIAAELFPETKVFVTPKTHDSEGKRKKRIQKSYVSCGQSDNTDQIIWEYDQEKGKPKEYAARIEIYN